jgi:hypothetical protein
MNIRADYDPGYFRRFLWLAIGSALFTAWCAYDAFVKYPHDLERAGIYWISSEDKNGQPEFTSMKKKDWQDAVREKGWSSDEIPEKPDEIRHKIQSQYLFAGIAVVCGVVCLLKWLLAKGSWVEGTDSALSTNYGPSFRFDQIESIDKRRWEKKGIARIRYKDGERTREFVFDDFKFKREPMGRILRAMEKSLRNDQILNGAREKEPQEAAAAASGD